MALPDGLSRYSLKKETKPSGVVLEPQGKELDFEYNDGKAEFTVPEIDIHQMVAIED